MKKHCLLIAVAIFVFLFTIQNLSDAGKTTCAVDVSAAPELTEFSAQLPALCEENYPKITRILKSSGFKPPAEVKLIFRYQSNPAETLGDTIYLSIDWFKANPDDLGAVIHELAHVVQSYQGNVPFWLQEGIADYVRYDLGYQNSWSYPHCEQQSPHYTSGYWCSAAFLGFVEETYKGKSIVTAVNARLRSGTYNDSIFQDLTGKSLDELWKDCLLTACSGGTP